MLNDSVKLPHSMITMTTRRRINNRTQTQVKSRQGSTTDLVPSVMGAIDAIWEGSKEGRSLQHPEKPHRSSTPRRSFQVNNFANLSPNVQKILSNVSDEELTKNFSSEEYLEVKKGNTKPQHRYSPDRQTKSNNETLEIISPTIQKILSNLSDAELVNQSCTTYFVDKSEKQSSKVLKGSKSFCSVNTFLYRSQFSSSLSVSDNLSDHVNNLSFSNRPHQSKPLGSYLHTLSSGIASRTPTGRKSLGRSLEMSSENGEGNNNTSSVEVSRPLSLTSLGSCSSSSSGGHHQPSSAYLASVESLDSDPEPTGSQGSADSGIAEQLTMSSEHCVLQEVVDTEAVYVSDLREVIEGYLIPWREDSSSPLFEHLKELFSNLEEIYHFNRSFLEEIRQANCNSTLTANAFIQNNSGFSIYTEYCTNYPRTMSVLTELTGDEDMASLFRERQLALQHALPLGSYLLKPVQRILKYHLLLQRLSKQCDHPHKPTVDLALATMTGVASHINTMKRKHEHAVRVQEIQSQLYGWSGPDLTALGELIAEGTFRVVGARGRRHVFLFDKLLLIAKSKQEGYLAYKSHIMCSNLMLVEQVRGEPLSFHIIPFDNPRQQCTLRARSPQHKREWTLQLKRVILENYSAVIPNHARQLVMQLGQNLQEDDATDKWSPLKHHSTPHYLEKRGRLRKSSNFTLGRRSASQERSFTSLASWRRKSEPGINQYNSKTLPKRISKIRKTKEQTTAKFYTDLSDSENCSVDKSTESLLAAKNLQDKYQDIQESSLEGESESRLATTTLEKVVSDLLMQNAEFHKLLNRQRSKNIRESSEPCASIWSKRENDELPSKADSLPRDFQLNDRLDFKQDSGGTQVSDNNSTLSNKQLDVDVEDLQERDLSSQFKDSEHPDHRIYRKSAIRFSLVQRFRAIISEEQQKRVNKLPSHKQGSESMGAKIANPDYVDPQKLFCSTSTLDRVDGSLLQNDCGDYIKLDLSINEDEVLNCAIEKMSDRNLNDIDEKVSSHNSIFSSSQNSDDYYENLMEKSLNEENAVDAINTDKNVNLECGVTKAAATVKRPNKPPPPIPVKPSKLAISKSCIRTDKTNNEKLEPINRCESKIVAGDRSSCNVKQEDGQLFDQVQMKGWVKTIVGRFE